MFSLRFDQPVDDEYSCIVHAGMQGIVHVTEPAKG